jgi:6-phosphogluconolactonase
LYLSVKIFPSAIDLAEKFAEELITMISVKTNSGAEFNLALSGGSTPELLYSVIGDHFSNSVNWDHVNVFWGDERCVPPDDPESNFGMAQRSLFGKINIPETNIHRIKGECDPGEEASRYSDEIALFTDKRDGYPVFDLIILGIGEDGHTASIFPSDISLMESEMVCEVATHPVSLQKRITITGRTINNASKVAFLVTGRKKGEIVEKILNKCSSAQNFPASRVVPVYGELLWFMDSDAALLYDRTHRSKI